jgi:hypothetical protein
LEATCSIAGLSGFEQFNTVDDDGESISNHDRLLSTSEYIDVCMEDLKSSMDDLEKFMGMIHGHEDSA